MSARRWLWLWLLVVLALAGCRAEDDGLDDVVVELTVMPDPPYVGPVTVVVSLTDDQGAPIAGATLLLEGNMTHPGMVPSLAEASEVSPGRYEAVLDLTMGGDWYILVQGELPDGRALEHTADLPGVKSPSGGP
jgi:hypothetical protein